MDRIEREYHADVWCREIYSPEAWDGRTDWATVIVMSICIAALAWCWARWLL